MQNSCSDVSVVTGDKATYPQTNPCKLIIGGTLVEFLLDIVSKSVELPQALDIHVGEYSHSRD